MKKIVDYGRYLGIRLPLTIGMAMEAVGEMWKWVENQVWEPEIRMRQLREKSEELQEFMRADRSRATECAVTKGRLLLQLRALNGPIGWDQLLRTLSISRRTASNLIALALFSKRSPDVFDRLKRLGPTKLYRLARLSPEALKEMDLDADVSTERGVVKLRHLTDRELETHLRKINPPRIRTTPEKLRSACVSMRRMLENVSAAARPPREDLEMIRDVLREATARVMDMLGIAA